MVKTIFKKKKKKKRLKQCTNIFGINKVATDGCISFGELEYKKEGSTHVCIKE